MLSSKKSFRKRRSQTEIGTVLFDILNIKILESTLRNALMTDVNKEKAEKL